MLDEIDLVFFCEERLSFCGKEAKRLSKNKEILIWESG